MARTPTNQYKKNPVIIEVFSSDIDLAEEITGNTRGPIIIKLITFVSAAAGDDFVLTEPPAGEDGVVAIHLAQNISGGMTILDFGSNGQSFNKGLYFDADQINAGLGANDRVCIYLK